jgi:hypothetical protein
MLFQLIVVCEHVPELGVVVLELGFPEVVRLWAVEESIEGGVFRGHCHDNTDGLAEEPLLHQRQRNVAELFQLKIQF